MNENIIKTLSNTNKFEEALSFLQTANLGKIVFSTSFGLEDQVITHAIFSQDLDIEVFTLDTGRLFPETYNLWSKTINKYNKIIKPFYPSAPAIEQYVIDHGINAFYDSVTLRKECCKARKVEPLNRALQGANVWITGLRAEQSENRHDIQLLTWEQDRQLYKYNPLLLLSIEEVKSYINEHNIPFNPLHDQGFVSIGCAPCTRAITPGENTRAGRWWWEEESKKECGLHK
jgi:phosphoadenosine phosphosulfate reductase